MIKSGNVHSYWLFSAGPKVFNDLAMRGNWFCPSLQHHLRSGHLGARGLLAARTVAADWGQDQGQDIPNPELHKGDMTSDNILRKMAIVDFTR